MGHSFHPVPPSRKPPISELEQRLQAALGTSYRIQKELGGGGMSRVFLAEETRLGRQVVVKVLPPEMGAAVNIERFEREIQLAARLQHPHVVSLLTAASSGDLLYYIMPYIAGESLRAKLERDGALPVPEAVRLLREIVDALAYAHQHNVVHRDIKPDNVLLSTGHAVVTDFGVAKAVSASSGGHSSLTSLGVALGTPAYMAPEQAAADPHVDHRADIYAVGALAYEMLAGRTPFMSPTPHAMLAAHITKAPDPLSSHRNVSPALNAIVMRCLEKHPADRFQTAGDLLAQLEVVLTPSGGSAPTDAVPTVSSGTKEALKKSHPVRVMAAFAAAAIATLAVVWVAVQQLGLPDWVFYGAIILLILGLPIILATGYFERKRAQARATGRIIPPDVSGVHRHFTWQRAIRGGFLAFAGLGIITAGYSAMRLAGIGPAGTLVAAGKVASSSQLIVADFVNRTTDTTLGPTLTEAMRIDLAQSRIVRILSSTEMLEALQRMEKPPETAITLPVAREMATREGAKVIVAGEVNAAGRSYLMVARLLDATDGKELLALRETSPDDAGIVDAIDRLSARLRERIGESLRTIRAGVGLARATTSSLEALRLYSEAIRLSASDEDARAIPLLRQAVSIDSGFAMAWRKLAVSLTGSGGKWSDVAAAARRAYQLRDRLTEAEAEATKANYFANVVRDNAKLEAAYLRMLELDPGNEFALPNLAAFYTSQGRCAEGERLLRPHVDGLLLRFNLLMTLTCAGNFTAVHAELARIAALTDSNSAAFLRARALALAVLSPDSGIAAVKRQQSVLRDTVRLYQAARQLATMEAARGRLQAADSQITRIGLLGVALENSLASFGATMEQARIVFTLTGDSAAALTLVRTALSRTPLKDHNAEDWPAGELAIVYAMVGHVAQAKQVLTDYEQGASREFAETDPAYFRARAWIALAENRPADAITEIRRQQASGNVFDGNYELGLAFEKQQMTDSAIAYYERAAGRFGVTSKFDEDGRVLASSLRRAGELYESKGDKTRALDAYGRLVDLWKEADPVLQPQVKDVKARMAKLAGEPK